MEKQLQLFISGDVQGVAYRASTQRKAVALGIRGRVQNLPDGRVYVELEGPESALREMVAWCWEGPPFARVEKIEQREAPLQSYTDFQVIR